MAVTPAGAEVSNAVATNWKKIWKKNLKPLADKRYYTKAKSDAKYQPKGSYETAGSGYSQGRGRREVRRRGIGVLQGRGRREVRSRTRRDPGHLLGGRCDTAAAVDVTPASISFGVTFSAVPTVALHAGRRPAARRLPGHGRGAGRAARQPLHLRDRSRTATPRPRSAN